MLPYVFVMDLHLMSADELNEMLSVLNSYDRELPPQLEKLRAEMLDLRNKREKPACLHPEILEDVRFADGSIDGRCAACGEAGFPIRDVPYEEFKKNSPEGRHRCSVTRMVEEGLSYPKALEASLKALGEVAQNPTCKDDSHDVNSCPICLEQQ